MYEVASAATLDKSFDPRPAIVLPYMNLDGQPMASHPKWPDFYRVRYLTKSGSFDSLAANADQKYAQPPGTGICAYLPNSRPWVKLKDDASAPIVITEGELKAAAACALEFNTIGLGGVWSFRSAKRGVWFLPELEEIKWVRRKVYICYDSDFMDKPQICLAINALAQELEERGADVYVIMLPDVAPSGKTGLDDYFLEQTAEDFEELMEDAPALGVSRVLWRMNDELVYVEDPGFVAVIENRQRLEVEKFKGHSRWATQNTTEVTMGKDGGLQYNKVSAAPTWIKWPMRRSVAGVTYAPGQPTVTDDNKLNQWKGWGVAPKKGNVKPWLELCEFIFQDVTKEDLNWFYDWCAYPVQNPGTKLYTSVVVHGLFQGTGKSLVGYTLGRIYGENFKEVTSDDLEDGQTWWAENKQFIMGDEITGNDNRKHANMLKRLITQERVSINIKYIPQFDIPDCINYYFTAQHPDSFFLEDADRRFFVNEVTTAPLPLDFYEKYDKWIKTEEGAAAVFQWLLDRKINPSFNPRGHAPRTMAKARMIMTGKGDLALWLSELKEYPDQVLRFGEMEYTRDLFSAQEIADIYNRMVEGAAVKLATMTRALGNAGFPMVNSGVSLRSPDGRMTKYFAIRNIEAWMRIKDRRKLEANLSIPTKRRSTAKGK